MNDEICDLQDIFDDFNRIMKLNARTAMLHVSICRGRRKYFEHSQKEIEICF